LKVICSFIQRTSLIFQVHSYTWAQFCCKMWVEQLGVKPR